jgi:uncharacterized membrane protein YoaK (UPF0700 family)
MFAFVVLHRPHEVTSLRHLPSWALLAFGAGAVNAGALLACERYVSHVTGTVTRIGVDAGKTLALEYAAVLACFIAGAAGSVALVRLLTKESGRAPYWIPLSIVSTVVALTALLGAAGVLGPFGGSVETPHDFALLCVLGFAMGAQNAAVASSTGLAVRTTHMTGPATDLAIAIATLTTGTREERPSAWRSFALRGTKIVAFATGGVAMAFLCPRVAWLAFLVPATATAVAVVSSFLLPIRGNDPALEGES